MVEANHTESYVQLPSSNIGEGPKRFSNSQIPLLVSRTLQRCRVETAGIFSNIRKMYNRLQHHTSYQLLV